MKKSEKVINLSKEPESAYKDYSKNYSKKPLAFRTNTVFKENNTPAVINKAELESKDNEEKRSILSQLIEFTTDMISSIDFEYSLIVITMLITLALMTGAVIIKL